MPPMGFPPMMGTPFYPGGFMNPWPVQQAMMGPSQGLVGFGANSGMSSPLLFAAYDMLPFCLQA